MIVFVSLFLGLVLGEQTVEVAVTEPVARVELLLDDRPAGTLDGPPWSAEVDFGDGLIPHRLEAVAYDEGGGELERIGQWINLMRSPAEASVVLEGGEGGRGRIARLSWESVIAAEPHTIRVSFDGRLLEVTDPRRIELPDHDPRQLHFFQAELEFDDSVTSLVEVTFGGTYADDVNSRLTAVPVELAEDVELPPIDRLAGWLVKEGGPLEVVAADAGSAEIVVVPGAAGLRQLVGQEAAFRRLGGGSNPVRRLLPLSADHRAWLLWPYSRRFSGAARTFDLFPPSPLQTGEDGGFYWILARARPPAPLAADQRLADALAVAGMTVAGRKRPRLLVLVLGEEEEDESRLSPAQVRRYLEAIQVPLVVWSTDRRASGAAGWGEVVDISHPGKLAIAYRDLVRRLDRQRILWVDGVHLPQQIELAAEARAGEVGVELVR